MINLSFNGEIKRFLLGSIYVPTNFPRIEFNSNLDIIESNSSLYDGMFIGGDFTSRNTSWGNTIVNLNGQCFYDLLNLSGTNLTRLCGISPCFPVASLYW